MRSTNQVVELLKTAYKRNNNIIITGDFNYKDIDWRNDFTPIGQHHLHNFIETLKECYLYQHVTEPTRYRENETPNLLDLIISNEEGMIHDLEYLPSLGESDHVCLSFKVLASKTLSKKTTEYNVYKTNYNAVKSAVI